MHKMKTFFLENLFSEESKFNLLGSNGRIFVWRKPGERLWLFLCFTTVELVFIDGIINSEFPFPDIQDVLQNKAWQTKY